MSTTTQSLTVWKRNEFGKGASRKLRRQGKVPATLYGHGMEPVSLGTEHKALRRVLGTRSIISLEFENEKEKRDVFIKDFQRNCLNLNIIHVDFQQVKVDETITVQVPLETKGTPMGIAHGGLLDLITHTLTVECLPKDLPERLVVDVSPLEVGDSISIGAIPLPEGVNLHYTDADTIVVHVITAAKTEAAETGEEETADKDGNEPEIISKGKKTETDEPSE